MRREAARLRRMQRHILFVALIMLLALGVVSVSFSYFSQEYLKPTDGGSLIFEMRTAAAKRDLADTGAAADLSDTGADADLSDSGAEAALTDTGADADLAPTGGSTIYVCISDATMKSNSATKVYTNVRKNETGSDWVVTEMSGTDKFYNGKRIYSASNIEQQTWGGLGCLQILLKDDSGNQKTYKEVFTNGTWTASSNYAGKLYNYDGSAWVGTYSDASYANGFSTGDYYIHNNVNGAWYGNGTSAPKMTKSGSTYYYDFYLKQNEVDTTDYLIFKFWDDSDGLQIGPDYEADNRCTLSTSDSWSSTVQSIQNYGNTNTAWQVSTSGFTSGKYYKIRVTLDPVTLANSRNGRVKFTSTQLANMNPTFSETTFERGTEYDLTSLVGVTAGSNVGTVSYSTYQYSTDNGTNWTTIDTPAAWTPDSTSINKLRVTATDGGVITTAGTTKNAKTARTETYATSITVQNTNPLIETFTVGGAATATLNIGETAALASTTSHSTGCILTYSSEDDDKVSIVEDNGVYSVQALAPCTDLTITATLSKDGVNKHSQTVTVLVNSPVVTMTYSAASLWSGDTLAAPTIGKSGVNNATTVSTAFSITSGDAATINSTTGLITAGNPAAGSITVSMTPTLTYGGVSYVLDALTTSIEVKGYYVASGDTGFTTTDDWDATDSAALMTKTAANTYKYTSEGLTAKTGNTVITYQFKVATYDWGSSWPSSNQSFTVDHTGDYVEITFNSSTHTVTVVKKHPTYTITFHENDGTIDETYTKYVYTCNDATFDLPTDSQITKSSNDFIGWHDNSGLTGAKIEQIENGSVGNKEYWAEWRPWDPIIDTFTIDNTSSATLAINDTATLKATYRYPTGVNRVEFPDAADGTYTVGTPTVTSEVVNGRTVYTSTATLTAKKPATSGVTITARLTGADSKTVTATINNPSVGSLTDVSLYIDQDTGTVSAAVSPSPVPTNGIVYSESSQYFSVDASGNVSATAIGSGTLNIRVHYNSSYYEDYTRTINVIQRKIYLVGLKNEYSWNYNDNNGNTADTKQTLMVYNETNGLYELDRELWAEGETYYGTADSNPDAATTNDTGFRIVLKDGDTITTFNNGSAGYIVTGEDHALTLDVDSTNEYRLCVMTKNAHLSTAPYRFQFDYGKASDASRVYSLDVLYPMIVTFDKQGRGTISKNYQGTPYGLTITAPTVSAIPAGYVFDGWYKEAVCTNQWNFETDTVTSDITLYAKWTAKSSSLTFVKNTDDTVTYKHADGTSASGFSTGLTAVYDSDMPYDASYGGVNIPVRTGYNFQGFYDASSGGNQYYDADGKRNTSYTEGKWKVNTTDPTTLYAQWTPKQSALTFDLNNVDTDNIGLVTATSGTITASSATYDAAMPSINATPTLTGYTFMGFYDAPYGGTQYYGSNGLSAATWDKDTTSGTTLYAHWQILRPTVQMTPVYRSGDTTYAADGTITPATLQVAYKSTPSASANTTDTLTSANTFTSQGIRYKTPVTITAADDLSGYTFNGIYTLSNGGTRLDTSTAGTYSISYIGTSNVVCYARYTKNLSVTLAADYTNGYNSHASTMSTFTLTATADGGVGNYSYTYEYSIDGGIYQTIASDSTDTSVTFNPIVAGEYTFRVTVKDRSNTTASNTASAIEVEKDTSVVYTVTTGPGTGNSGTPTITVWGADYSSNGSASYYRIEAAEGGPDGIYGGDKLKITVARPNTNHYIESVAVTMGTSTTIYSLAMNSNSDLTIYPDGFSNLSSGVTGDITITYVVKPKPTVTIGSVTAGTQSLAYQYEGASATPVTAAGTCSVDYGSTVIYTVTPDADHYLVSLESDQYVVSCSPSVPYAGAVTGTLSGVTVSCTLTPTFAENPVVHVNQPEFGSIWVTNSAGTAYYLDGEPVPYGTVLKVHVAADADMTASSAITTKQYNGSDYYYTISSASATVGESTESMSLSGTGASLHENLYNHTITANTTFSAVITHFNVSTNPTSANMNALLSDPVPLGYRRIFFTDIKDYADYDHPVNGEYSLYAHYSLETGDYYSLKPDPEHDEEYLDVDSVQMKFLYTNDQSQKVYYATIPAGARYVSFANHTVDSESGVMDEELGVNVYKATKYTASFTLYSDKNAFYPANSTDVPCAVGGYWQCHYADIRTVPYTMESGTCVAGEQYAQQASTGLNRAVEFSFLYDNPYSTGTDGYLEATKVYGDAVDIRFTNTGVRITPTELSAGYSLVKIKSKASLVEKYYLIRIYPVEIKRFDQLQKLFNSSSVSSLSFNMIARGVELSYQFLSSLHNNNDYTAMTSASGIVEGVDEVINGITYAARSLTVNYSDYQFLGMQYFQARITGNGQTDTKEQHTVFDLDSGTADGVLYFKNATRLSVEDIHVKVVARFTTGSEYTWVTMQELDSDNHELLRTPIPTGATSVQFYLMYEDKYSADMASMSPAFYYARSADLSIRAGKMYRVTSLYTMSGSYVNFRQ